MKDGIIVINKEENITYISKITKVKKAYDDFLTKHQRTPTDEELIKLYDLIKSKEVVT